MGTLKVRMIKWFVSFMEKIICPILAHVSWVEKGFSQEMNRVAITEAIGGWNLRSKQSSYIFKAILHPLFNLHVLIRKIYVNTSGNNGCKWISQWENGEHFTQTSKESKTAMNSPPGGSRIFRSHKNSTYTSSYSLVSPCYNKSGGNKII